MPHGQARRHPVARRHAGGEVAVDGADHRAHAVGDRCLGLHRCRLHSRQSGNLITVMIIVTCPVSPDKGTTSTS